MLTLSKVHPGEKFGVRNEIAKHCYAEYVRNISRAEVLSKYMDGCLSGLGDSSSKHPSHFNRAIFITDRNFVVQMPIRAFQVTGN